MNENELNSRNDFVTCRTPILMRIEVLPYKSRFSILTKPHQKNPVFSRIIKGVRKMTKSCPEDKVYFGCLRFLIMTMYHTPANSSVGSRASWSEASQQSTYTGRYVVPSPPRSLLRELRASLETESMPSLLDQNGQVNTFGRTPPLSPTHDLNLEQNPFVETPRLIGRRYGQLPRTGMWNPSPQAFVFRVIERLDVLEVIMQSLLQSNVYAMCTGVELVPARVVEHGMNQDSTLILKIPEQNSGTVTRVKSMLSSTNLEEVSTYLIFSGGSTAIQYVWKSKVPRDLFLPQPSGSPRMLIQETGILR